MSRIALAQITSATNKGSNLKLAHDLIGEAKRRGARISPRLQSVLNPN